MVVPSAARSLITPTALPAPRFRYTPVVVAGGFAFVSGLVGLDAQTGALAEGGAYGQSRRILANLRRRYPDVDLSHVERARRDGREEASGENRRGARAHAALLSTSRATPRGTFRHIVRPVPPAPPGTRVRPCGSPATTSCSAAASQG